MEPTEFRPPELRHSMSVLSATLSSGSSGIIQPSSVGASSILPVVQLQGFMGHRVQRTSGDRNAERDSPPVSPQQDDRHCVYTNQDSTLYGSTTTLAPSIVGLFMYSSYSRLA